MDAGEVSGYGLAVRKIVQMVAILVAIHPCGHAAVDDLEDALDRAREAARNHRYADVIAILTPFNAVGDPESRYITAAEIGRALFHLGNYAAADRAFREAVSIHPERAETAVYFEATSFLLGHQKQAMTIFREILASGARDLYLAVTLPGERQFLADPEVQSILAEHAVVLDVDVGKARLMGVALGDSRERVAEALAAGSSDPTASALTANAGPAFIWAFVFDAEQRLAQVILQAENLLRYTPYRLRFGDEVDWRATPATAIAFWGPPTEITTGGDGGIAMIWDMAGHRLTLGFARPRSPRPPEVAEGAAVLRSVRLETQFQPSPDRMDQ
jgi:tetratricopeptide (TPR) repeat protein